MTHPELSSRRMPASASSLGKGLALLTLLGTDEALESGGLSVMRISALSGREKSQVSRVLRVLADSGFVERDPETLRYSLSWELFALAARAGDRRLLAAAPPMLAELVSELGETAHLSSLQGSEVLTLLSQQPAHAVRAIGWTGRRTPAECTSSGRALLLDHDLASLEALFGSARLALRAGRGASTCKELHARIVASRVRGWVAVEEEFEPGLVAVGAPVRGPNGRILAAINVSAPSFRFAHRLAEAGPAAKAAADRLSARLGAPAGATDMAAPSA
jgi:IclR family transcriptional regulator, KDG regulon repressor